LKEVDGAYDRRDGCVEEGKEGVFAEGAHVSALTATETITVVKDVCLLSKTHDDPAVTSRACHVPYEEEALIVQSEE